MDSGAFLLLLRKRSRLSSNARDPLAEVARFLETQGETGEGRAVRKVFDTLISGNGTFSESEVWLFGPATLALVVALIEARTGGGPNYSEEEWQGHTPAK